MLRDGRSVGEGAIAETSFAEIVRLMVGREIQELFPRSARRSGEALLAVRELAGEVLPRSRELRAASRRGARRRRSHGRGPDGDASSTLRAGRRARRRDSRRRASRRPKSTRAARRGRRSRERGPAKRGAGALAEHRRERDALSTARARSRGPGAAGSRGRSRDALDRGPLDPVPRSAAEGRVALGGQPAEGCPGPAPLSRPRRAAPRRADAGRSTWPRKPRSTVSSTISPLGARRSFSSAATCPSCSEWPIGSPSCIAACSARPGRWRSSTTRRSWPLARARGRGAIDELPEGKSLGVGARTDRGPRARLSLLRPRRPRELCDHRHAPDHRPSDGDRRDRGARDDARDHLGRHRSLRWLDRGDELGGRGALARRGQLAARRRPCGDPRRARRAGS